MNINVIIGIIMILSFLGMVWYCVKGFNLMVGFAVMATFWTALAVIGNVFSPTSAMEGKTFIQVLEYVYAEGPAGYAKSILVNVFFGAFFGSSVSGSSHACLNIPSGKHPNNIRPHH